MPGKTAAASGRRSGRGIGRLWLLPAAASGRSGGGIGRLWLLPAAASGRSGGGIGRLRLRPAIPVVSGGRGKRQRSAAAAAPSLPDDALADILSRVPAKSRCRFKCVSRAWRDLIADRLRCNRLPQTLAGFFLNDGDDSGGVGEDRVLGHLVDTLGRSSPLASISFMGDQPGIEEFGLLRSCNGLLLFGHRMDGDSYDSLGYIVCNPATEQWVAVPSSGFKPLSLLDAGEDPADSDSDNEIGCTFTYLIFEPAVSPHFQLVEFVTDDCVCVEEVRAYSSETGAWHEADWNSGDGISFFAGSAFVNGMLHLSAVSFETNQELILVVDVEGRDCRSFSGPEKRFNIAFIGESQGLLHCVNEHRGDDTSQMSELSIWVLQDYDAEEWVLKHSVSFLKLFGRTSCRVESDYNVVAIHPDRNLIFFVQHWDLQLKSYDMDSKEVCAVHTLGVGPQNIFPYVTYYADLSALANKHRNCAL